MRAATGNSASRPLTVAPDVGDPVAPAAAAARRRGRERDGHDDRQAGSDGRVIVRRMSWVRMRFKGERGLGTRRRRRESRSSDGSGARGDEVSRNRRQELPPICRKPVARRRGRGGQPPDARPPRDSPPRAAKAPRRPAPRPSPAADGRWSCGPTARAPGIRGRWGSGWSPIDGGKRREHERIPGRRHQQHRRADRDRARARPGRTRRAADAAPCASTPTPPTRSACCRRAGRRRRTRS